VALLLAVDIGNTNVKFGVFDGDRLLGRWVVATDAQKLADEYAVLLFNLLAMGGINRDEIRHAVFASVVPTLSVVVEEMFERHFGIKALRVGAGIKTGMRILYEARELAPDRIAVALGALRLHKPPLVVVHLGTGTVFEAVSREGDYMGGAIAPGVGVAAEALAGRAAMLRSVELRPPRKAIGSNTASAMQSGILFGYAELIQGMVRRFKEEIGQDAFVIATGGWSKMFHELTDCFDHVDENLSLSGLRQLYELNEAE
jgi:type III pantothenate kinase